MADATYNSVRDLAWDLLKISKEKGIKLTPLQLMKLCYISYGWYLGFTGKKLFPNEIQAWKYGPVIPDLYHHIKRYARNPIPFEDIPDGDLCTSNNDIKEFLQAVIQKYGKDSGPSLSTLTHQEGTPWSQVYESKVSFIPIPKNVIELYYKNLIESGSRG